MKIKELIEQLKQFDGELDIAAYLESRAAAGVYEVDVPKETSRCRRSEYGGLRFLGKASTDGLEVVLLGLVEV